MAMVVGSCSVIGGSDAGADANDPGDSARDEVLSGDSESLDVSTLVIPADASGSADRSLHLDSGSERPLVLPGTDTGLAQTPVDVSTDYAPGTTGSDASSTETTSTKPSSSNSDEDDDGPGAGLPDSLEPATREMPTVMVAVRGAEQVILIDTADGTAWPVFETSLEVDAENQIGPSTPASLDLARDGVVRFDMCCADAAPTLHTIDLSDRESPPRQLGDPSVFGASPSASPAGEAIAYVEVNDHEQPRAVVERQDSAQKLTVDLDPSHAVHTVSWATDGSVLAVGATGEANGQASSMIALADPDTGQVERLLQPQAGRWSMPQIASNGLVVVNSSDSTGTAVSIVDPDTGETLARIGFASMRGIVDLDFDASGEWLLIVDGSGRAHAFDGVSIVTLPGDGFTAASW